MRIIYCIRVISDEEIISPVLIKAISLPKGCGIDSATKEIKAIASDVERISLELHKAHTEGRPVDPAIMWPE